MSLSTQDAQTQLFEKTGTFFAFSKDQYEKSSVDGVEYAILGAGMITPKEHVKTLVDGLADIHKVGIENDLKENSKQKIIERELHNFECFYTGNIDDCFFALEDYGITKSEIRTEYNRLYPTVNL